VTLNARKNGGDWHDFGLRTTVVLSPTWQQYNVSFVSSGDGPIARLSWFVPARARATALLR
jgi:hypothetical protein